MTSSMYRNLAVITFALGLLGLVAGCLGLSVSFEPEQPDILSKLTDQTATLEKETNSPSASKKVLSASTTNVASATSKQSEKPITENSSAQSKSAGSLRMSNKTDQPVRLALLARHPTVNNTSANKNKYNVPAHWDFDPQEGSDKGLILSLPEGNLKLNKGDILVAFAQDGSRRYWGPYVVGETPSPKWNPQTEEWELILIP
ncbi:hypothetical protein [Sphaerospermopsis sp. LEGE 08334]|uniref:hypothetical protein n=1 Tax=Sphaerospermopsis sp. LEGE 08334 TaxID=1828651 RepID=UPI001881EA19|nr:hypothetical protein [Sphaerospermopsis sp. LEGE 08334]MBE9056634.1 hypothetical protein [Sphaerospermopsis sp. LEGE 08334]